VTKPGAPGTPSVYTRPVLTCLGVSAVVHAAVYLLNTSLPVHVVALGGSKAQVGMLFSVATTAAMVVRPLVGGWNDRHGFRPVVLPGVAAFLLTTLALQWLGSPGAVVAAMAGLGLANGLISTSAGVLVARVTAPEHRGEALSLYYVASSLGWAVGPPLGLLLYRLGGVRLDLAVAAGLALAIGALAWSVPGGAAPAVSGPGGPLRLYSRHALPAAGTLVLTNLGHSAVYAFLPLYAMAAGLGRDIAWFYVLFSAWLIACRLLLRRVSDRVGRARVVVPAIALIGLAYLALAWPPRVASLAAAAVLLASGASLLYPTLVALLVDRTPERERGLAIGTLSASFDVGVVVGSLLMGVVVEQSSYGTGFIVAGVGAALGLAVFVTSERRRARPCVVPRPSAGVSF
jgi:MFS family permease